MISSFPLHLRRSRKINSIFLNIISCRLRTYQYAGENSDKCHSYIMTFDTYVKSDFCDIILSEA